MCKLVITNGGYLCPTCNCVVKSYSDYYRHYREIHQHFNCIYCGKPFQCSSNCDRHEKYCKLNPVAIPSKNNGLKKPKPIDNDECGQKKWKGHHRLATRACKYCGYTSKYEFSLHAHENRCKLNPNKDSHKPYVAHKHSAETKQLLSNIRKEYLKEHPESHVWKRNDKFKSAPCELLKSKLASIYKIDEEYTDPLWVHNYSVDIVLIDKKIGIEVNGNQHYNKDGSLKPYYQARHDYLLSVGWVIIEVHYAKVYKDDIIQYIQEHINNRESVDRNVYNS